MSANPVLIEANRAIGSHGVIHLYRPDEKKLHPFIIGIHGGGWQSRDQTQYEFLWPKVKPLGFALALVSYRQAPRFRFPHAYEDLLSILLWLKEHGESHHLDTSQCVLFGASAGGHLAMLLATRAIAENRPAPLIRGVAQYCGMMDLADQYRFDEEHGDRMTKTFLGVTPDADPQLYRDASPSCHLHRKMPPVWMAHGTADKIVPVSQSREMARRLREAGHDPVYLEARGLPHTVCEWTIDGRELNPFTLLFEHDLLRFFQRAVTRKQTRAVREEIHESVSD